MRKRVVPGTSLGHSKEPPFRITPQHATASKCRVLLATPSPARSHPENRAIIAAMDINKMLAELHTERRVVFSTTSVRRPL